MGYDDCCSLGLKSLTFITVNSRLLASLSLSLLVTLAAASAQSFELSTGEIPAGCRLISGIYLAGPKTGMLYDYKRYAIVLPPLSSKSAQSFQCGSQRGSLLVFQYRSDSERDQAMLFAKPVLTKEKGLTQSLEIRELKQGFIVVSFKQPPSELLAALDKKLSGTSMSALPTENKAPTSTVVHSPFSPVPVITPVPVQPVSTPPPTPVVVTPAPPPARPPIAVPALPSPAVKLAIGTIPDLNPAVIGYYLGKIGCGNPGNNSQIKEVCGLLKEFQGATPPPRPFKSKVPLIGPIYTIDSYGRVIDLHYVVIEGSDNSTAVSFISLISAGGREDFEIQSLLDARRTGKELPSNSILEKIQQLVPKKQLGLGSTTGPSLFLLPGGARKVFLRKSRDHLILIGTAGNSFDEQTGSTLVVAPIF